MKRRVAILISGRGSNMAALIQAAAAEDFPAQIVVVVSIAPMPAVPKPQRQAEFRPSPSKASRSARIVRRSRRF
jgi:folate-dependent phosphoribosylglycinamide formyltransferase PurN